MTFSYASAAHLAIMAEEHFFTSKICIIRFMIIPVLLAILVCFYGLSPDKPKTFAA